jgi:hypothetical protein
LSECCPWCGVARGLILGRHSHTFFTRILKEKHMSLVVILAVIALVLFAIEDHFSHA